MKTRIGDNFFYGENIIFLKDSFSEYLMSKNTKVIYQKYIRSEFLESHRAFIFPFPIAVGENTWSNGLHVESNPILFIEDISNEKKLQLMFCCKNQHKSFLENALSGIQIIQNTQVKCGIESVVISGETDLELEIKKIESIPFPYVNLTQMVYCDTFERTFEACATKDISPIKETLDNFLECELPIPAFPYLRDK